MWCSAQCYAYVLLLKTMRNCLTVLILDCSIPCINKERLRTTHKNGAIQTQNWNELSPRPVLCISHSWDPKETGLFCVLFRSLCWTTIQPQIFTWFWFPDAAGGPILQVPRRTPNPLFQIAVLYALFSSKLWHLFLFLPAFSLASFQLSCRLTPTG